MSTKRTRLAADKAAPPTITSGGRRPHPSGHGGDGLAYWIAEA